ncbi:MAG: beta-xylosidase [Pseudopedobacter saltans]|uniref:Beta-xylosidase n=1 Tax=Pseudopedobacter saltans TaxID=151895 RepID=A0A2W5EZL4_9SPHI|nr:MAG: beta-xylosidase [Pseudopedobacter saltans]
MLLSNMKYAYRILVVFLLVQLGIGKELVFAQKLDSSFAYMADPTMFYENGVYYLSGTYDVDSKSGIRIYYSKSIHSFSKPKTVLALKKGDAYGTSGFWAPQILKSHKEYSMLYVANEHIAIAHSSNILGPYKGLNIPLIQDRKSIDPYVFEDDDGSKYLFHVEFSGGNKIYVARLKEDLSAIVPASDSLCLSAEEAWETKMDKVVEGPTVFKHGGWYYLLYSANHFKSKHYAVGYAVSKTINGPWLKYKGNPVLSLEGTNASGSGHGDIVSGKSHNLYYVFHTHNSDTLIGPRKTAITKIYFKRSKEKGPDELYMDQKNFHYLKMNQ